ncbi:MAG: ATP-binding protein [Gammaproteobacteria bacterium RIFCSPHIGHO2_12_FULL_38_11]|nr:MAG: ATP-binding protein [Gammaproteobacteria bacterium RIFCSPHIGHO2_12_FULL_38_11]
MTTITPELLKDIIADQREEAMPMDCLVRTIEKKFKELLGNQEIIVLTGVRRCGKSVLLNTIRMQSTEKDYYFNFEDERLATFTSDDFQLLYQVFLEEFGEQKTFYFDEIQNIPGWEMFVRRLYNAGNKIMITGSNATLFSEELGTRLTGRYIQLSVYPFSFYEYLQHEIPQLLNKALLSTKEKSQIKKLFNHYCEWGGIPAYLRNHEIDYLQTLYDSIIYRDIVARYKLTDAPIFKKMVFFLASNCSKETTYNALRKFLGLGSVTTVSNYCVYLENSYLCFFLNRYHASVKTQNQSPKKVYFIDHVLAKIVGFHFSEDRGRLLENIVFIELKRRFKQIYYHAEKKECDFIIQEGVKIIAVIQVCASLANEDTKQREMDGLLEALSCYSLKTGTILTESEEKTEIVVKDKIKYQIKIIPLWKWLIATDSL